MNFRHYSPIIFSALLLAGCASEPQQKVWNPEPLPETTAAPTPPPAALTPEQAAQAQADQRIAAISNAKAAAAKDPMNWRVFNELGVVYYSQGMYDQAIAAFQQALALHPVTSTIEAETRQEEAEAAQRAALEAKRQAAIDRAKAQQSQQEMNDLFGMVFSVAGASGGRGAQGIQMLQPVLETMNNQAFSSASDVPELAPEVKAESSLKSKRDVAVIYANLGMAYFGKKSYPQAVASFENVMQLDPSRMDVLKTSADAQYRLSKYDECITTLTRYHALAPVEPASMLLLSESFHALGMEAEADKVFKSFLAKQDTSTMDAGKLMELGTLCLTHCRYAEAADFLTKARAAAPKDSSAYLCMLQAEAEFGLAQAAKSAETLKQVAVPGAEPRAWYMLGRCQDELGDCDSAATSYKNAIQAFGSANDFPPSDNYILVCRSAAGQSDAAIDALEKRLESVPLTPGGGAEQWCLLAFAYEKAGRIPEAIEILNRCNAVNPAYAKVGLTLARLGRQVEAERNAALASAEAAADPEQAVAELAKAYRLTPFGKKKEDIRLALLRKAASMEQPPMLTSQAQDHYLRGNAALKAAKSPMDLGRSLSEFQWAVFHSPWVGDIYFSTSAVKNLQNRNEAAVQDLKFYLTAKPGAENVEQILNRLYEFDYQREQKLRELESAAMF